MVVQFSKRGRMVSHCITRLNGFFDLVGEDSDTADSTLLEEDIELVAIVDDVSVRASLTVRLSRVLQQPAREGLRYSL
jgi:hypothetical protein